VIVILVLTFSLLEEEGLSEIKCSPLAVRKLISIDRSGVVLKRDIKGIESGWTQPPQAGGRHESCLVQTKPKYKDTIKEQIYTCLRVSSQRRNECSGEVSIAQALVQAHMQITSKANRLDICEWTFRIRLSCRIISISITKRNAAINSP
jgi:hypothetical protein